MHVPVYQYGSCFETFPIKNGDFLLTGHHQEVIKWQLRDTLAGAALWTGGCCTEVKIRVNVIGLSAGTRKVVVYREMVVVERWPLVEVRL